MLRLIPLLAACLVSSAVAGTPTHTDLAYGPAPEQRYDIYAPTAARNAPAILMVHGGGWFRGDKDAGRVVDSKQTRWLPKGIAFATTNYRMQPDAPPLEQACDVASALADLQRNAGRFGLDPDNIVLMGHSAGAHLIALLAARPELLTAASARPPRGYVLLDSGALDVPEIMNRRHFRLYDRAFGNNPADWLAASPLQQLHRQAGPLLIACSLRRADACPQGRAFAAKATGLGGRAELLPLDKTHGEINFQLGDDEAYTARVEAFLSSLSPAFAGRLDAANR